jgi:hypothetical protein
LSREIEGDTMQQAIIIGEYLLAQPLAVFGQIGIDQRTYAARRMLLWLDRDRRERFSVRDCLQAVKGTLRRADEVRVRLLSIVGSSVGAAMASLSRRLRLRSPRGVSFLVRSTRRLRLRPAE